MCTPRLIILYKSKVHGHPVDLHLNFKFINNDKFENIRKDLVEKASSSGLDDYVVSERIRGINSKKYVYIDPYDYIKNNAILREKYTKIKKLPIRPRRKEFRKILALASANAYLNLAYFINLRYDIVFVNPGDVGDFLKSTDLHDYKKILYYDYTDEKKDKYDMGDTHNISTVLPHVDGALIVKNGDRVLEFYESMKFINVESVKKMDEGGRLIRYFKPAEQIKGGTFNKKKINILLKAVIIAAIIVLLIICIDFFIFTPWCQQRLPISQSQETHQTHKKACRIH